MVCEWTVECVERERDIWGCMFSGWVVFGGEITHSDSRNPGPTINHIVARRGGGVGIGQLFPRHHARFAQPVFPGSCCVAWSGRPPSLRSVTSSGKIGLESDTVLEGCATCYSVLSLIEEYW